MNKLAYMSQNFEATKVIYGYPFTLELVEILLLAEEKGAVSRCISYFGQYGK